MPGYGISDGPDGLLPWTWAEDKLSQSRHFWVATRTEDGAPHLAAVWAVWHDGALYFSTGEESRKARNLGHDPRCSASPADAVEAVVLEGTATRVADAATVDRVREVYAAKYGMAFPDGSPLFALRPTTGFGMTDDERFTTSATRWRFG